MKIVAVTTLSSRGQIVIPEILRKALGLEAGDKFYVGKNREGSLVFEKIVEKVNKIMSKS